MELPAKCSVCGYETMLDLRQLEKRPISKLVIAEGFICEHCGKWEAMFFTTLGLSESLRKLEFINPASPSFRYFMTKAYRRAIEIQRRGKSLWHVQT